MAEFLGDTPQELYQATFKGNGLPVLAKFARKGERVVMKQANGEGYPRHSALAEMLGVTPYVVDDFGAIGVSYSPNSNPPYISVIVNAKSHQHSNIGSAEAREETGRLLEPYFTSCFNTFLEACGNVIMDFYFTCEPFPVSRW